MEALYEAERETLKLRLLAIAAVAAGLYIRQNEILTRRESLYLVTGLAAIYLVYTLSLRSLIIPRFKTRYLVYVMIVIDALALLVAMHLAGGFASNIFILFPLFIIFYAIHLEYYSSFFAAIVISFSMVGYAFFKERANLSVGTIIAFQVPLFFILAYFSGWLAHRASQEREKREALQEFIQIESGTKGLREVVQVITRTLEIYEEWVSAYTERTLEKEAIEKLRFSLSIDAQYALAHYSFGCVYADSGQLSRAVEAFRRAVAMDPNLLEAYRGLSEVLLRQGRFDEALEPALKYAEGASHDWVAHQNLAVIYNEMSMPEESHAAEQMALATSTDEDREALVTFFSRLRGEKAQSTPSPA